MAEEVQLADIDLQPDHPMHFPEAEERRIRVRYHGHSKWYTFGELGDVDVTVDTYVKTAVASLLSQPADPQDQERGGIGQAVSLEDLGKFVIERHVDGNMTLRPEASFGEFVPSMGRYHYGEVYVVALRNKINMLRSRHLWTPITKTEE